MSLTERILAKVEELRGTCADQTVEELYGNARNHHLWAMGCRTNEEATEHEITADAFRILAREKERGK